jgi:hypothetical protein
MLLDGLGQGIPFIHPFFFEAILQVRAIHG